MQDTVQTTPETFTGQAPATVPDRTITYQLRDGSILAHACPDWCVDDHAGDIEGGLSHPSDLRHEGAPISLGFEDVDGERETILAACLVQWPFDTDSDPKPYIDLTPEASTAESMICRDRLELDEQIRRVRAHLNRLIEMGDRLAEAQADDHAHRAAARGTDRPWASLNHTDLQTLPIAYLLKVFGVTVVESDEIGPKVSLVLGGEPGDMLLMVQPDMPQHAREDETRTALLAWYEAQLGGRRG